jgi:hypothetical protein
MAHLNNFLPFTKTFINVKDSSHKNYSLKNIFLITSLITSKNSVHHKSEFALVISALNKGMGVTQKQASLAF